MSATRLDLRDTKARICRCGSSAVATEVLKPGQSGYGTHYAKFVCHDCGRFNGWARDPRVTAAADQRATDIDALLKRANVTEWERGFLRSISRSRHLTEKQEVIWQKILAKLPPKESFS